jgi:hypothetical protein
VFVCESFVLLKVEAFATGGSLVQENLTACVCVCVMRVIKCNNRPLHLSLVSLNRLD